MKHHLGEDLERHARGDEDPQVGCGVTQGTEQRRVGEQRLEVVEYQQDFALFEEGRERGQGRTLPNRDRYSQTCGNGCDQTALVRHRHQRHEKNPTEEGSVFGDSGSDCKACLATPAGADQSEQAANRCGQLSGNRREGC